MIKKILAGLAVVLVVFLGYVATRPATYRVERSVEIAAPADVVFAQLDDFRAWEAWSPWEKLDPGMQKTHEGPARAVGTSYAWQGNDQVGKGKMTITELDPGKHLAIELQFVEPFASVAKTGFDLSPVSAGTTRVTWSMDGNNDFMGKLFGTFMDVESMIGADYDKGLGELKTVSEAQAAKLKAEAEAAAAAERARLAAEAEAAAKAQAAAAPAAPATR